MRSIAHITFNGGGLVVPASEPYDRELVFEHAEGLARRHGTAHLSIGRRTWQILCSAVSYDCARCRRPTDSICYQSGTAMQCTRCARGNRRVLSLRGDHPDSPAAPAA